MRFCKRLILSHFISQRSAASALRDSTSQRAIAGVAFVAYKIKCTLDVDCTHRMCDVEARIIVNIDYLISNRKASISVSSAVRDDFCYKDTGAALMDHVNSSGDVDAQALSSL
jgi:hypothetical protein